MEDLLEQRRSVLVPDAGVVAGPLLAAGPLRDVDPLQVRVPLRIFGPSPGGGSSLTSPSGTLSGLGAAGWCAITAKSVILTRAS